ncbi:hypothetical protein VitviT2T_017361 [Vitis vinifera]|uniref:Peptidase metallopeptidase domain-containing protein n=2 Tax=Vitis vinifera TaxID=29760 RepID=A0ABY9CUQ1_VITVI|nr:metalloendoproteinase 3-MMP-like [Vitis vinifera]WJZ98864.1 hypothetical protein VitviT2T_017361 [Vitis vinifera]|eukprot:XP_003633209.1 PREDICTED: metalloendoproteinase 3-MMP-like [Vitis vinifera]
MVPNLSPMSFIFLFLFMFPITSHANGENPSPFEFIKDLEGCQKGHKVKDIHKLKKYLQQFGYLSYSHSEYQTHADNDDFDDLLEFAIKTYQTNYYLKASGNLDSETVSVMVKPRCGVADIINGTSRMRSGSRSYPHGYGSLHTVAHYSFFAGSPRWPPSNTHLTYAFLSGTSSTTMSAVTRAFGQWASATDFTFAETQDYTNADMKIGFQRGDHGDGFPFDGPGGTIAHSFSPTDGRLHFDGDESWVVGAVAGAFDVETVALHEIGHLLGLGHSSVEGAIIFPTIAFGVTKGLNEDDIQGIQALYNFRTRTGSCSYEIM